MSLAKRLATLAFLAACLTGGVNTAAHAGVPTFGPLLAKAHAAAQATAAERHLHQAFQQGKDNKGPNRPIDIGSGTSCQSFGGSYLKCSNSCYRKYRRGMTYSRAGKIRMNSRQLMRWLQRCYGRCKRQCPH